MVKENNSKKPEYTRWVVISAISASMVGSFIFGLGISGANLYSDYYNFLIQNHSNEFIPPKTGSETNTTITEEILNGLPQSLFVAGCFIGAFTASLWPKISPIFNRNVCLILPLPFYALSCVFTAIGYRIPSISEIIYAGRVIHGYASGLACVFVPVYLHEISTLEISDKIGIFHQLFITLGILFANIVGYKNILGNKNWIYANTIGILPACIGAMMIPFIPKSPKQLILRYKDDIAAKAALEKLRNGKNIEQEIKDIKAEADFMDVKTLSPLTIIKTEEYRWPMITSVVILTCQAMCGINAVFFYSGDFLRLINNEKNYEQLATLFISASNVLFTFAAFPIIKKFGIRTTLMVTLIAMFITHIILAIVVKIGLNHKDNTALQYSIIVVLILFVFFFAIGIGPIAFMYPSDVLDRRSIDTVLSIGLCFNYGANIFVGLAFLPLKDKITGFVFLLFAAFILFTLILLAFKMQPTNARKNEDPITLEVKGEIIADKNNHVAEEK